MSSYSIILINLFNLDSLINFIFTLLLFYYKKVLIYYFNKHKLVQIRLYDNLINKILRVYNDQLWSILIYLENLLCMEFNQSNRKTTIVFGFLIVYH